MSSPSGAVRSGWILAAVSTALFCVQIDYFAMNLALPRMATDLDSNATDLRSGSVPNSHFADSTQLALRSGGPRVRCVYCQRQARLTWRAVSNRVPEFLEERRSPGRSNLADVATMKIARVPAANAKFELTDVEIPEPGPGQVRVKVHACGVCHSDSLTVIGGLGNSFPRAPGHEIAGAVDAVGDGVSTWKAGDRVGVGWFGGCDFTCEPCRRGDFISCENGQIPGIAYDGGYAEYMVAPAEALARIPDDLSDVDAAPLMCAGITTFNALRESVARPGDVVAILGVGGLGHLGIQFAARMGFEVVAIARGTDKEPLAKELGAHHYIDSEASDVADALNKLGGAQVVLATVTVADAMTATLAALKARGQLVVVGAPNDPLQVSGAAIIFKSSSVQGHASGTSQDSEDTLRFSALTGVRPMIETVPLAEAQAAYDKMMSGAARFRMVLTMD